MGWFFSKFDFRDASLQGSPTWCRASPRFAVHAPKVVIGLAILSIVEVVLGVVWITSITSLSNGYNSLSFSQVIQPLIVPALSFFNTIPSLHLHILARSNQPLMAFCFSSILAVIMIGSAVVFLPPCIGVDDAHPDMATFRISGYRRVECPLKSNKGVWAAMVALQFVSGIGYAVHAGMAWLVRKNTIKRERDIRSGDLVEMVNQEEKEKREEEARRRWREIGDL